MEQFYLSPLKPPDGGDNGDGNGDGDGTDGGDQVTEESGKRFLEEQKKG